MTIKGFTLLVSGIANNTDFYVPINLNHANDARLMTARVTVGGGGQTESIITGGRSANHPTLGVALNRDRTATYLSRLGADSSGNIYLKSRTAHYSSGGFMILGVFSSSGIAPTLGTPTTTAPAGWVAWEGL